MKRYRVRWLRNDGTIQELVVESTSRAAAWRDAGNELCEDCESFVRILRVEEES